MRKDYVLRFGEKAPVLINGKVVLYKVEIESHSSRMDVAKKIFEEYGSFSSLSEVIQMIRSYEKTGDFVRNARCAYILHDAN